MSGSLRWNWIVWISAVTACAAVLAILASAVALSPETDRRDLPEQMSVASVADPGVAADGPTALAPDTGCKVDHGCAQATMASIELALTGHDSGQDLSGVAGLLSSQAALRPFHPPRFVSQV